MSRKQLEQEFGVKITYEYIKGYGTTFVIHLPAGDVCKKTIVEVEKYLEQKGRLNVDGKRQNRAI